VAVAAVIATAVAGAVVDGGEPPGCEHPTATRASAGEMILPRFDIVTSIRFKALSGGGLQ
jgi:hypothetical protein